MTSDRWRQIEDLFDAAQKCHPAERAALLQCTDPEIRSRVERMLEVESGSQILDQWADGLLADLTQTALAAGTELGPYRIEAQVGAGGMGTVYRALDTRLGRVVAVKIASERYSQRFQVEARAISALNHPHVCTLYDVGPNYLVMEFIEGSTLAAELKKGSLAPEVAALYGAQIADALAEAHAAGIVHRDLKPTNIILSSRGVKVLDFGLAKVAVEESRLTGTRNVMGTPAYMAPEQLDGKPAGPPSDLFSLGLVLYEMAAGQLPYPGASLGSMLLSGGGHAVTIPPLSRVHAGVPAGLDALTAQLLEADPSNRPPHAANVRARLQRLAASPKHPVKPFLAIAAAVALLMVAGGLWLFHLRSPESPATGQVARIVRITSYEGDEREPSLSPDGSHVAFSWNGENGGNRDIYVAQIGGQTPLRLTQDPAEDSYPAWSPDGKQIAFLRARSARLWEIHLISALGGSDRKLREVQIDTDTGVDSHPLLAWSPTGDQIVFTHADEQSRSRLFVLSLQNGSIRALDLGSIQSTMGDSSPAVSPDGQWLIFRRYTGGYNAELMVQRLRPGIEPDGAPITVPGAQLNPAWPCWSPDSSQLIFADNNRIFEWKIGGAPRLLYASTTILDGLTAGWPAGHLRVIASGRSSNFNIWSLPIDPATHRAYGPPIRRVPSSATDNSMSFSPDGKRFAFVSNRTGSREVWLADRNGANLKQLTRLGAYGMGFPRWSADGKRIAFHAGVPSVPQLYLLNPDEGAPRKITNAPLGFIAPDWMPDGQHLVAWRNVNGEGRLFRVRLADGFGEELSEGTVPVISLDGKRILYGKFFETGMFERALKENPPDNPEEELVQDYRVTGTSGLAPARGGIYYVASTPQGKPIAFRYFDYATRRANDVAPAPPALDYGLTVSRDEREMLYSATSDPFGDDLLLLEFQ
jgi:Tol biopolymer transport system component/predicted Ser/Thr protein kinase